MTAAVAAALLLAQSPGAPLLSLEDALREAEEKNLDLKQARARLRQADELSWKAWSSYLPQLTAGGTYTRNEVEAKLDLPVSYAVRSGGPSGGGPDVGPPYDPQNPQLGYPSPYFTGEPVAFAEPIVIQKRDQLGAQLELRQAILAPAAWPAIANAYKAERVAELTTENVRREVLFGVAQAYYGTAALEAALRVSERQLALTRDQEKDARVRFQAGAIPKVALLRAQLDRAKAEEDLKRAQNALATGRLALATLLDRPRADFEVQAPVQEDVAPDAPVLEATALRKRPDVLAARESLSLAEGQRSAVWFRYAPTLGGFAQYRWANIEGFTGKRTTWALGLALTWSILDGGLRESDLREASARAAEAEAALRGAEARALEDVRTAVLELDSARANRAKAREQAELARENQRLVEVSFKAGAATHIEVADANAQLRAAELNHVAEGLAADLAAIRLQKAAGLWRAGPGG